MARAIHARSARALEVRRFPHARLTGVMDNTDVFFKAMAAVLEGSDDDDDD